MTPWKMAITHLVRRKAMSLILLFSLAFSVGAAGLLLRVYILSQSRFDSIARGGEAIVGAKAGGIEILLGSLNLEASNPGVLPMNLFRSMRAGQTVKFEDGAQVPTSEFIESIIPMLFFASHGDVKIVGTDQSFFSRPRSSESLTFETGRPFTELMNDEVVLGSEAAEKTHLKVGDLLRVKMNAQNEYKEFSVVGVLKPTGSAWDRGAYAHYQSAFHWLSEKGVTHAIWKEGVFNYFLLYMKASSHGTGFDSAFDAMKSLVNDRTVGQLISVEREKKNLADLTGAGGELGLFFIGFIILLSTLSVSGMMMVRFEGMRLQTAIMRAMGFSAPYLLKWLIYEGLVLSVAACAIGAIIDGICFFPVVSLLGRALPDATIYSVSLFSSFPIWLGATLATLMGVAFPFTRLYKQDVHSVLKGL